MLRIIYGICPEKIVNVYAAHLRWTPRVNEICIILHAAVCAVLLIFNRCAYIYIYIYNQGRPYRVNWDVCLGSRTPTSQKGYTVKLKKKKGSAKLFCPELRKNKDRLWV